MEDEEEEWNEEAQQEGQGGNRISNHVENQHSFLFFEDQKVSALNFSTSASFLRSAKIEK